MSVKNKISIKLIFLTLPFWCFAQNAKEIDSLLDISTRAYENYESRKSIDLAKKALEKSTENNLDTGIAEANYNIARALSDLGKQEESFQFIEKAEKTNFAKTNPVYLAKLKEVSAMNYMTLGLYPQGITEFHKTLLLAQNHTENEFAQILTARVFGNLFVIYRDLENPDSAYYYLNKETNLLTALDESEVYTNLSLSYLDYGSKYIEDKIDYDSAEYYFQKSLALLEKYNDPYKQDVFCALGDLNYEKENYKKALDYYLKTQKLIENLHYSDPSFNYIFKRISEIYQLQGKSGLEEKYLRKFVTLEDSISDSQIETVGKVTNGLLRKHELRMKQSMKKTYSYIGIAAALFLIGFFSFFFYYRKNQRKKFDELESNERELAEKENENQILKSKLNESFDEIIQLAKENNPGFLSRFSEIYPDFVNKIHQINPGIQSSELSFCALLFLNFSTKDIAEYTFVTPKAVQNRKNRIRKKLHISSEDDIYVWMQKLGK
jgi:hypothetical protein